MRWSGGQTGRPTGAHREVNLASVFTQTTVEAEGYPIHEDSTSHVGAIENCEEFGRRLYAEAWRRGWGRADKRVMLGDGSKWI